ncbi:hypothetical protein PR048_020551 [Dryococelus australis]|uniref:Uncharacterized protein n=1 Tax=Dryococelus australis TaxID=614101 RepID=A0ABQ9H6L1_9NEOP|nr:hypothetical protein PR048_020551 [Dryococelus australis]
MAPGIVILEVTRVHSVKTPQCWEHFIIQNVTIGFCVHTTTDKHQRSYAEGLERSLEQTPPGRAEVVTKHGPYYGWKHGKRTLSSRHCTRKTYRDGGVPSADMRLVISLRHHELDTYETTRGPCAEASTNNIIEPPLKVPLIHAVRPEHCTPVQSLALSGDGALIACGSVAFIARTFRPRQSHRYMQHSGNCTSVQRVGAKGNQTRLSMSSLSVPRFPISNAVKTSKFDFRAPFSLNCVAADSVGRALYDDADGTLCRRMHGLVAVGPLVSLLLGGTLGAANEPCRHSLRGLTLWRRRNLPLHSNLLPKAVSLLASHHSDPRSIPATGSLRIFSCGNRAGRCRWSSGFSRESPVSPLDFRSGAAPYSPQSPTSALKTSILRAVQISSLTKYIPPISISSGICMRNVQDITRLSEEAFAILQPMRVKLGEYGITAESRRPATSPGINRTCEKAGATPPLWEPNPAILYFRATDWCRPTTARLFSQQARRCREYVHSMGRGYTRENYFKTEEMFCRWVVLCVDRVDTGRGPGDSPGVCHVLCGSPSPTPYDPLLGRIGPLCFVNVTPASGRMVFGLNELFGTYVIDVYSAKMRRGQPRVSERFERRMAGLGMEYFEKNPPSDGSVRHALAVNSRELYAVTRNNNLFPPAPTCTLPSLEVFSSAGGLRACSLACNLALRRCRPTSVQWNRSSVAAPPPTPLRGGLVNASCPAGHPPSFSPSLPCYIFLHACLARGFLLNHSDEILFGHRRVAEREAFRRTWVRVPYHCVLGCVWFRFVGTPTGDKFACFAIKPGSQTHCDAVPLLTCEHRACQLKVPVIWGIRAGWVSYP